MMLWLAPFECLDIVQYICLDPISTKFGAIDQHQAVDFQGLTQI